MIPIFRAAAALSALLVLLPGCQRTAAPAVPAAPTATRDTAAAARVVDSAPPDTHILDLADRTEVWLTAGRVGRGPTGAPCLERGIQLRRGPLRIQVPLLYTSELPVVIGGKLVASLSTDCVSGQRYTIDAVTGYPTKRERADR